MAEGLGRRCRLREHALRDDTRPRSDRPALRDPLGDFLMTWQTPTAVDFRFGFEITMYVAAR